MSKERLEEIKELHEKATLAYEENDFIEMRKHIETLFLEEFTDWLIEQAERVQALEFYKNDWMLVVEQNKRYREALKNIRDINTGAPHQFAVKALEGEK